MKKKVVIIIAAVMAVVAIGFGIALGFNLGMERSLKIDLKTHSVSCDCFDFTMDVSRYDTYGDVEQEFYCRFYNDSYFVKKSIICVDICDYDSFNYYTLKGVRKNGKDIDIIYEKGRSSAAIVAGTRHMFLIGINKWDLLGVRDIEVIIEEGQNNEK